MSECRESSTGEVINYKSICTGVTIPLQYNYIASINMLCIPSWERLPVVNHEREIRCSISIGGVLCGRALRGHLC